MNERVQSRLKVLDTFDVSSNNFGRRNLLCCVELTRFRDGRVIGSRHGGGDSVHASGENLASLVVGQLGIPDGRTIRGSGEPKGGMLQQPKRGYALGGKVEELEGREFSCVFAQE